MTTTPPLHTTPRCGCSGSLRRIALCGCVLASLAFHAVPQAAAGEPEPTASKVSASTEQDPGLRDRIERFAEDRDNLRFRYREPLSSVRQERFREFYRVHLADLQSLDFDALTLAGKADFLLLKNELEYQQAKLRLEAERNQAVLEMVPGLKPLVELIDQHESTYRVEPKKTAEILVAARQSLADPATQTWSDRDAPPEADMRTTALAAAEAVQGLSRQLQAMHQFYEGYHPEYSWWCQVPYEQLAKQLDATRRMLRDLGGDNDDPDKILGQPIGEEAMALELRHEMIAYTPEELIEIAEREFEWCDQEMLKASRELGFGDDWRAAMEAVKQRHVPPGEQPEMIRQLAEEAVRFLKERDLVSIPPLAEEVWRMEMMSPERQRLNPFFLGGRTIIVSYPTDTMTHAEKMMSMRGNNIHFARATVHHELIPGHHLQMFMMDRYRPYRQEFNTPFWIEGWALYWEMLLWDKDFPQSPEDRIGMLFWRKHRCARIIFSLGYQLGRMTPEECVDYLVERVGHERLNAAAEVRRSVMGGYRPLYQAAYMLGGLQIKSLRRELVDGGKMSEKEFHDAILREGPIPIAMVRAMLSGEVPAVEEAGSWRFAE